MEASENTSLASSIERNSTAVATAGLISHSTLTIGLYYSHGLITAIVVLFGTVANIINAIVYFKIGFKESINISLWVLAISDFGCCLSLITFTICYNPLVRRLDLPFDPDQFNFFPATIHNFFTRLTAIITCLITVERCLCVVAPLKVKQIVTPKRVSVFLACTIVILAALFAPHFYTARYQFQFIPKRNKSIIVVRFRADRRNIDSKIVTVHGATIPFSAFLVMVIATIVLVVVLRQKTKWRKNVTSSSNPNNPSTRDAKISRMVLLIAAVFIAASLPLTISSTVTQLEPEYFLRGRYRNLYKLVFSIHFNLEAINSSLIIFIYYHMSSAYKAVFLRLFGRGEN